jgi:hypothetical protein
MMSKRRVILLAVTLIAILSGVATRFWLSAIKQDAVVRGSPGKDPAIWAH